MDAGSEDPAHDDRRAPLLAAEDRGDGLHEQLNVMDSIWAFDVRGAHLNHGDW